MRSRSLGIDTNDGATHQSFLRQSKGGMADFPSFASGSEIHFAP